MAEHNITVQGGSSVRLKTAGKYCDRDIVVTAEGGGAKLPSLYNPAGENDVRLGKDYVGGDGSHLWGAMHMDGVWTPDWSTYVPVHIGYDSDDRFLVMDNTDGIGGGGLTSCTVYVTEYTGTTLYLYYTDANGQPATHVIAGGVAELRVAANTALVFRYEGPSIYFVEISGSTESITGGGSSIAALFITGDADIAIAF